MHIRARLRAAIELLLLPFLAAILLTPAGTAAQSAFDPDLAQDRLDSLNTVLREDNVSIEKIQDAQRRAVRIRDDAMRCARTGQALTDQLNEELELLGEATDRDPAEMIEQRTSFEVEIRRSEARVGACRLLILHTEQLLSRTAAMQAAINTRRLTDQGINGPSAVARFLDAPGAALDAARAAVFADPRLRGISRSRWALVLFGALLAAAIGWALRRVILEWCHQQRGRAGKPTVRVTLLRRLSENAPWLLAGGTVSIALALYAAPPRGEIVLFRLALGLLIYGAGRAVINWIGASFSPGTPLLTKPAHVQHARTRLHALLLALALNWLAFGPGWLVEVPEPPTFVLRALLTIYLVAALLWVLRMGRVVPSVRGRLGLLRLALGLAALAAVGAELAGYRNFANYLLGATLATLGAGFVLWTLIWSMRQSLQGVVSGTSTVSYRIRSWMGMRQEEKSAELGWLHVVISIALWIAFGAYLIRVWDPTGNAMPWLRELTLLGIDVGGNRIVPRNIFVGVTAFGIIIAITAWLKARLNRRWLRDMGMDRHAREALVTVSGYAGFAVAILIGLTLAGVSFAGMALVFGALGVGIGFGLQNIVNNFVSGLILLFERPIKAGDFITIGEVEGIVKEVRTRATDIETLDRQNVLVPNSELVSNQVTNWVLRDPHGRLTLQVGVAYGSDTAKVQELLLEAAKEHPDVVKSGRTPEPRALFMAFGDSALEFELRVWIRNIEKRFIVTSDLNLAIDAAFRANGVVVPFPQRDLHIYPVEPVDGTKPAPPELPVDPPPAAD